MMVTDRLWATWEHQRGTNEKPRRRQEISRLTVEYEQAGGVVRVVPGVVHTLSDIPADEYAALKAYCKTGLIYRPRKTDRRRRP